MTDTTNDIVLNTPLVPPGTLMSSDFDVELPGAKWLGRLGRLGWLLGGVGLAVMVGIVAASLAPATLVAEKENRRLMEMQEAPFAQTPASAESVNERVVFGDLPDEVKRFETNGDFFFVTVSAPEQSLLSWFAGRG